MFDSKIQDVKTGIHSWADEITSGETNFSVNAAYLDGGKIPASGIDRI
jgi:hypothetical protein